MLVVVYQGVATPLIKHDLAEKDTSLYDERIALFDEAPKRLDLRDRPWS